MAETKKIPERAELAQQDKWAIEDIYATDELWEADLEKARGYIPKIAAFAGHLGESAQMLLAYAQMEEEIEVLASDLANYAMRRADEDVRVAKYQAMTGRLMSSFVELNAAGSFATPELMAIPDETFEGFFNACPELERYRRYLLDIRRRRAHVLSPAEEKLLAAAGEMAQAPDNIYGLLTDADMKFPDCTDGEGNKHPLSHGTYISYMESGDRALRKSAFENLYHTYGSFGNTIAAVLASNSCSSSRRPASTALPWRLLSMSQTFRRASTRTSSRPFTRIWTRCTAMSICAKSSLAWTSCICTTCTARSLRA